MNYAECPNCEQPIKILGTMKIGKVVTCLNCNVRLEISWLDPIELDWPAKSFEKEEEDYDDDEYEYEDEVDEFDYED